MKYLLCSFILLSFIFINGMQLARENKLIVSMVQNNTRAYFRFSVLDIKYVKNNEMNKKREELLPKLNCSDSIQPFFLAERLSQSLPSAQLELKEYYATKNDIVNQGVVRIENIMKPKEVIFLFIHQKSTYAPTLVYSLSVELYNSQLHRMRTVACDSHWPLKSNKLCTTFNFVLNSENLDAFDALELEAMASS